MGLHGRLREHSSSSRRVTVGETRLSNAWIAVALVTDRRRDAAAAGPSDRAAVAVS
jgi:hypothetical protein